MGGGERKSAMREVEEVVFAAEREVVVVRENEGGGEIEVEGE